MYSLYQILLNVIIVNFGIFKFSNQLVSNFSGIADEVHALRDVNFTLNYRHYSGYLKSLDESYLHYWFFESQSSTATSDPLVLWLNGGPGCSSLMGALAESGPLKLCSNGSLVENPFSWNLNANLLFLESPVGVGFSYQINSSATDFKPNDNTTAQLNFEALRSFYLKFPHLAKNDFYLAGESYAGIYIPTLSMLLLEHNFPSNFKGISIGNGLLNHRLIYSSRLQYGYKHGLVSKESWSNVTENCCPVDFKTFRDCSLHDITVGEFSTIHIGNKCAAQIFSAVGQIYQLPISLFNIKENCANVSWGRCANDFDHIIEWLNRVDVQEDLNIYERTNQTKIQWNICDEHVFDTYVRNIVNVQNMLHQLLERNIKVLLYTGDTDLICNFVGSEWFLDDLNLTDHLSIESTPWFYENRLSGYIKHYPDGLTYVKIHDAGHEVLRFKPGPGLKMFQDFVLETAFRNSLIELSTRDDLSNRGLFNGCDNRIFKGFSQQFYILLCLICFLLLY